MQLENRLSQKKEAILKKWFDQVIKTYPEDTSKFFGRKKDPFSNPVGTTIFKGLEAILGGLFEGMDHEVLKSFLDPIVRMRAVQGFSPSDSVSFILGLKSIIRSIIRDELSNEMSCSEISEVYVAVDSKIDALSLMAFDIYMACREKIYELKANEMKRTTFRALERAKLIVEHPEE